MSNVFRCPECGGEVQEYSDYFICRKCRSKYSITNGIVSFVANSGSAEVEQTTDAFGWQWNNTMSGHTDGSMKYGDDLFFSRYNLGQDELKELVRDKVVLDPAVGSGRVEHIFGRYPKTVYANDLSTAIFAAKKNLDSFGFDNIIYSRSDMQKLPFKNDFFDVVICHATLQHVEDPRKALRTMLSKLKTGGLILFDLYKKAAPIRDFCDDFVRSKVSDLKPEEAYNEIMQITKLGEALMAQNIKIKVPCDIPMLEIKAGEYDLQRFFYYKILKMFWNDGMSLEENHIVNFDWYYPKISPRFTEEEVKVILSELNVEIVDYKATEGGIGAIIKKL